MSKLILDKTKDHLQKNNAKLVYEKASPRDADTLLHGKLLEEATELLMCRSREEALKELGDLYIVLSEMANRWGINPDEVGRQAHAKMRERGTYADLTLMKIELGPAIKPKTDSDMRPPDGGWNPGSSVGYSG